MSAKTSIQFQQDWWYVFTQRCAKIWLTGDGQSAETHIGKYRAFDHINPRTENINQNSNASVCQAPPPVLKEKLGRKKKTRLVGLRGHVGVLSN